MMWIWLAFLTAAVLFLGVVHGYEHAKGRKARLAPIGMVLVFGCAIGSAASGVFDSMSLVVRGSLGVLLAVIGLSAYFVVVSRIRSAER